MTQSTARGVHNNKDQVIGERGARQEEQRRAQAQVEARAHAREERTIADTGAAGADPAGQRVRGDAANFAAAVSCPCMDTAAVARGQAATRSAIVLSDLQGVGLMGIEEACIGCLKPLESFSVLLGESRPKPPGKS